MRIQVLYLPEGAVGEIEICLVFHPTGATVLWHDLGRSLSQSPCRSCIGCVAR